MKNRIPEPTLRRLSYYLRYLERIRESGADIISSKDFSKGLGLSDAQVRRDLFTLGGFGKRGVGYNVEKLICFLNSFLGLDKEQKSILIGCGNLGKALLQYKGFKKRKFAITHAFDNDKRIIGKKIAGIEVQDIHGLEIAPQAGADQHVIQDLAIAVEDERKRLGRLLQVEQVHHWHLARPALQDGQWMVRSFARLPELEVIQVASDHHLRIRIGVQDSAGKITHHASLAFALYFSTAEGWPVDPI